jgi:mRNA interferase MazF
MRIKKFFVYTADLNPRFGTEPGKIRPVVVVQTDSLNLVHPSTLICPLTTKVYPDSDLLRVHLRKGEAGLPSPSDILVDQIRAIDNQRLVKQLGEIHDRNKLKLLENLKIIVLE